MMGVVLWHGVGNARKNRRKARRREKRRIVCAEGF